MEDPAQESLIGSARVLLSKGFRSLFCGIRYLTNPRDGRTFPAMQAEVNLVTLAQRFSTEDKAREYLEALRWPNGPACPRCGGAEPYRLTPKATSKRPGRAGLLKCRACRKQFTVTVGTIFEDSHIKLSVWLIAMHLMAASKKGISAHQLHRM